MPRQHRTETGLPHSNTAGAMHVRAQAGVPLHFRLRLCTRCPGLPASRAPPLPCCSDGAAHALMAEPRHATDCTRPATCHARVPFCFLGTGPAPHSRTHCLETRSALHHAPRGTCRMAQAYTDLQAENTEMMALLEDTQTTYETAMEQMQKEHEVRSEPPGREAPPRPARPKHHAPCAQSVVHHRPPPPPTPRPRRLRRVRACHRLNRLRLAWATPFHRPLRRSGDSCARWRATCTTNTVTATSDQRAPKRPSMHARAREQRGGGSSAGKSGFVSTRLTPAICVAHVRGCSPTHAHETRTR